MARNRNAKKLAFIFIKFSSFHFAVLTTRGTDLQIYSEINSRCVGIRKRGESDTP